LLREAHDQLGLPVAIFRPSEIMADSAYRGQVNVPDFFARLLAGIVSTHLAPKTFYADEAPRHYDGVPVEIVARAIAAASVSGRAGSPSYNVVNPHRGDGVSLDVIVEWVKSAGYEVERILDYDDWYRRFHDRLAALPEPARQRSPLAILEAWSRREGVRPTIDGARLLERLHAIDPSLADFPHVTEALIHKTLADMALLGIIEPPKRAT
jgi:fatty acid CoA ligase FadD9